jgi:HK97 family phage major capsid protein
MTQLDKAVADIVKRTDKRLASGNNFSLSRVIRALRVVNGQTALNDDTKDSDIAYLNQTCERAMSTGTPPGSYLVPTIQADEIIEYLNLGGVARAAGVRIWPMKDIQKMTIPTALQSPTWTWAAQTSTTTPSDPNLGQLSFNLNERRCLIAVPNQLIAVSVPAFDTLISELIGLAGAEHEDTVFFASTQATGAPVNIIGAQGVNFINANNNNANGGSLLFTDLLAVLAAAATAKAKPPFVWFSSPRTFFQRIYGMVDTASRPLFIPTQTVGLQEPAKGTFYVGNLLGFPLYVTPFISQTEAVGSGSNLSHLIFTNPKYLHIAQNDAITMAVSTEYMFGSNMTCLRATQEIDFGVAPAAGVQVLQGIS